MTTKESRIAQIIDLLTTTGAQPMNKNEHTKATIEIDLDSGFIKTDTHSEVRLRSTVNFPLIIEDENIVKSPLCTNKAEMISEIAAWQIKELCEKPEEEIIFLHKGLQSNYEELLDEIGEDDENQSPTKAKITTIEKPQSLSLKGTRFILLPPSQGVDLNWHVTDSGDLMVAHCYGFGHSIEGGERLARRIVACLNACKNMTDEELIISTDRNS